MPHAKQWTAHLRSFIHYITLPVLMFNTYVYYSQLHLVSFQMQALKTLMSAQHAHISSTSVLRVTFKLVTWMGAISYSLPSPPPLTQHRQFERKDMTCNLTADCNPFRTACICVHVIDIPQKETVQMVFSAIGVRDNAHPIHLHGHTFHVVLVGYPEYNSTTGFIGNHTSDIYCADINCSNEGCDPRRCTRPS